MEKDVEEANKVAANVQIIKDDCQKVWEIPQYSVYGSVSRDNYQP